MAAFGVFSTPAKPPPATTSTTTPIAKNRTSSILCEGSIEAARRRSRTKTGRADSGGAPLHRARVRPPHKLLHSAEPNVHPRPVLEPVEPDRRHHVLGRRGRARVPMD